MKRALLTAIVLAGCGGPRFEALTAPPPGKEASLDDEKREIHLSKGVALGFECIDTAEYEPCGDLEGRSLDPAVARVFPGYVDSLEPVYRKGPQPRAVLVVVGTGAGETELEIDSGAGGAHLRLLVEE